MADKLKEEAGDRQMITRKVIYNILGDMERRQREHDEEEVL